MYCELGHAQTTTLFFFFFFFVFFQKPVSSVHLPISYKLPLNARFDPCKNAYRYATKIYLTLRVVQGHDIYKFCRARVPDATCQLSRSWNSAEKFFTINGHRGHLGHVTWTIYVILGYPFTLSLQMKYCFN